MTARDALARVHEHATEYRRVARIVRAPTYPADNRCHRCGHPSDNPLIPWPHGWHCHTCTYPDGQ